MVGNMDTNITEIMDTRITGNMDIIKKNITEKQDKRHMKEREYQHKKHLINVEQIHRRHEQFIIIIIMDIPVDMVIPMATMSTKLP